MASAIALHRSSLPVAKLNSMFRGSRGSERAGVALLLLASLGAGTLALPHADERGRRVQSDPGRARRKRPSHRG